MILETKLRSNTNLTVGVSMGHFSASVVNALFRDSFILNTFWPSQTLRREGRSIVAKEFTEWFYTTIYQIFKDNKIGSYNLMKLTTQMAKAMNNRRYALRNQDGQQTGEGLRYYTYYFYFFFFGFV